jgi:hypothetical protein
MGIDYEMLRRILYIKLLMDGRRVPTVFNNSRKPQEADNKNMFLRSLWIYLLMGCVLIPFIIMKSNYLFQMSMVFGIVMFMVMSSMISDFSTVLLDLRDKNILGVRPVDRRTLGMAKTIHIFYYMLVMSGALVGPALIASLFFQGPVFFLLFLLLLILIDIFCVILTTLIYFLILRFFDGEKLKDIINYIQIILSLVIMIGYQLIGRMFQVIDLKINFVPHWWQYLIIPIWFSAPFQLLKKSDFNLYYVAFTIMAVVIPLVSLAVYIRLMPLFEKYLQKLGNNEARKVKRGNKSEGLLARLLCRDRIERIFYCFSINMMKNERSFKLKIYPTIGFTMIFPFIFILQSIGVESFEEVFGGRSYLYIYFCGIMLPTLITMMKYSESYKAAWIYKALPVGDPKPAFRGTMKALLLRIFVPLYVIEAIIFGVLFGIRIVPDLFVVFMNLLIFSIICFLRMDKALPFSAQFNATQQSNMGMFFLLFLVLPVQAGIHYVATLITYGVFINLCISTIVTIILWETAFHISMDKLD